MDKNRIAVIIVVSLLALLGPVWAFAQGPLEVASSPASRALNAADAPEGAELAVLAGGCFWGMEAVFEGLIGVYDVQSGYSGGDESTAQYYTVASGTTGHAESVEIIFDPDVISYDTLLDVFFTVAHDPTTLNYQRPDHGTQYRSAIFYANDQQRVEAERMIRQLDRSGVFPSPIVTQVVPLDAFYPAEQYHQDFMKNNPMYPYVVYWDRPKLIHLAEAFPELVADSLDY